MNKKQIILLIVLLLVVVCYRKSIVASKQEANWELPEAWEYVEQEGLGTYDEYNFKISKVSLNLYYSHSNKGNFKSGYYLPSIRGAFATINNSRGSVLNIGAGEYTIDKPIKIGGIDNIISGSDKHRTILNLKDDGVLSFAGWEQIISGFVFNTGQK